MLVGVGKLASLSVEELVLKHPDYLSWMQSQSLTGRLLQASTEAKRLVAVFDSKPFVVSCNGANCARTATRCSVYGQNIQPVYWCDECNPYSLGASDGKLQIIKTFNNAVGHVGFYCNGRKGDLQELILNLARAKGLPKRVGSQAAVAFFR